MKLISFFEQIGFVHKSIDAPMYHVKNGRETMIFKFGVPGTVCSSSSLLKILHNVKLYIKYSVDDIGFQHKTLVVLLLYTSLSSPTIVKITIGINYEMIFRP